MQLFIYESLCITMTTFIDCIISYYFKYIALYKKISMISFIYYISVFDYKPGISSQSCDPEHPD